MKVKKTGTYLLLFVMLVSVWMPNVFAESSKSSDASVFNKAYITSYSSGVVDVVDLVNNTIEQAKITVGREPNSAAINPNGTQVFVTNRGDDTVSVIDPTNDAVAATISVGDAPHGVAFNSDGSKAYVANMYGGSISIIDTSTLEVIKTISDLSSPVAFVTIGQHLYFTEQTANKVTILDTITDELNPDKIDVGINPYGLSINPSGSKIYVANKGGTVSVIDVATNAVESNITVGSGPHATEVLPDESKVYVANAYDNTVSVIQTSDHTVIETINVGSSPYVIGISQDGSQAYTVNYSSHNMSVIDTATNQVIDTLSLSSGPFMVGTFMVPVAVAKNQQPASSNADLKALTLSAGTLAPSFSADQTTYNTSVSYDVDRISVTAEVYDSHSTLKINETSAISGEASDPISLNEGDNTITVEVTAQDGTTKPYTITINRAAALSSNADLRDLTLSAGTLSPSFSADQTTYNASVTHDVYEITVTAEVYDNQSTFNVNGTSGTSETASEPISLVVGDNTIAVEVTAQDGTTNTYTITINRAAPSTNANLSGLSLSTGTLSPAFSSDTTRYTARVSNTTKTVTVTADVYDAYSTLTINDTIVTSGTPSSDISLKVGKNTINVEVTAQDDTTKQTYSIVLTRAGNNDDQAPSPGNEPAGTEEEQEQVKPITPTDDKLVTQSKVSTTIEKDENGTDITVVKLVQEVFKQQLADNKEAKAFVLPVQPSSNGKARATLQVRDVEDAANNNNENVFIIKTDGAEYSLPASIVNSLDAAKGLGIDEVNAADAEVQVTIEEKPASVMNENSGQLASKIVDFSIKVTNGESSYTLNNFGSTYVNRTFDLTEDVSASKLVGVVVNADGSIAPVPTEFVTIDGKKVAVLKRNSNSMYTVISNDASFTDIDQHWAEEAIELLGDKLIVNGYQDDSFKPQGTITRGEFATIIARSLGLDTSDTHIQQFSDVASSDWYAGALKAVVDLNLVYGYEDGTFKPNAEITRQDAAVILGRVIEFLKLQNNQDPQSEDFTDQHAISDYAVQSVTLAANMSIINGYEDQSFKPQSFIKRAEAVMMIKKLLEQANFISQ